MFKAPKTGLYSITASFEYEGDTLDYNEEDICLELYRRVEVGRVSNLNYKWYKFWKKEPKTLPIYEYEHIETVTDRSLIELNNDMVVFTSLLRDKE